MDIYNMVCAYCNKPFEASRSDARFCTDTCRITLSRKQKAPPAAKPKPAPKPIPIPIPTQRVPAGTPPAKPFSPHKKRKILFSRLEKYIPIVQDLSTEFAFMEFDRIVQDSILTDNQKETLRLWVHDIP